jgi:O-antigen ligase
MRSCVVSEAVRRDAAVWLLLAVPALLPFGRWAEVPLVVAALLGLVAIARGRVAWSSPGPRLALLLFAAYWLPQLVSAVDSVAPRKSWGEVAADLRFLPFLVFALLALHPPGRARIALAGLAWLCALWCLDALLQAATGWSLGGAARGDRLSGIFGDDNLKLGGVIAVLSPFLLLAALRRAGARGFVLALLPLLVVVLLAGARAAWIGLAVAIALALWHHLGARRGSFALGAALALAFVAALGANALSPRFAERVDRTAAALGGDVAEIDHALAGRLPIWRTALAMSAAHPVNGVGVRGFRHAYPAHAAPDDPWVDPERAQGALHAHQWLLELASETGAVGLLCWFAGLVVAFRAWRAAGSLARVRAAAPGIALATMLFPLNTHYAVYSSFWGMLLFLMLATWIGALFASSDAE